MSAVCRTNRLRRQDCSGIRPTSRLRSLYGPDAANGFARLFTEHLEIAAQLVKEQQAGTSATADTEKRWFANADAIAVFLSRINPYWSKDEWQLMLYEHLRLLSGEVADRLSGSYAANVASSDRIEIQALEMADMMTNGIIRQFPSAFNR